jgi:hypothetical protein
MENKVFDPCEHRIRQTLLQIGIKLFPDIKDVSAIFERLRSDFAIALPKLTSDKTNHFPTPSETGPYYKCPSCGKMSLAVFSFCTSCKEYKEQGLRSKTVCISCNAIESSPEPAVNVLTRLRGDFKAGPKSGFGIHTITDKEIK